MTSLPCGRCNGSKVSVRKAFTYTCEKTGQSRSYPEKVSPCNWCEGKGEFPPIDIAAIEKAIVGRKGLRSARPKDERTVASDRAYYVWRMARFHGGVDVTMPFMASLGSDADPFRKALDVLSDAMALKYCGTHMAAAMRWKKAGLF